MFLQIFPDASWCPRIAHDFPRIFPCRTRVFLHRPTTSPFVPATMSTSGTATPLARPRDRSLLAKPVTSTWRCRSIHGKSGKIGIVWTKKGGWQVQYLGFVGVSIVNGDHKLTYNWKRWIKRRKLGKYRDQSGILTTKRNREQSGTGKFKDRSEINSVVTTVYKYV